MNRRMGYIIYLYIYIELGYVGMLDLQLFLGTLVPS